MTGRCCAGKGPSGPIARRRSGAAASVLPGAVLVLLPKCPLCLAAWLTVITGIGVSGATAARVRGLIMAFSIAAIALIAARMIRACRLQRYTSRPRLGHYNRRSELVPGTRK